MIPRAPALRRGTIERYVFKSMERVHFLSSGSILLMSFFEFSVSFCFRHFSTVLNLVHQERVLILHLRNLLLEAEDSVSNSRKGIFELLRRWALLTKGAGSLRQLLSRQYRFKRQFTPSLIRSTSVLLFTSLYCFS